MQILLIAGGIHGEEREERLPGHARDDRRRVGRTWRVAAQASVGRGDAAPVVRGHQGGEYRRPANRPRERRSRVLTRTQSGFTTCNASTLVSG